MMRNDSQQRIRRHNSAIYVKPKVPMKKVRLQPLNDISNWRKAKAVEWLNLSMPKSNSKKIIL